PANHRVMHSDPTRRSSDLNVTIVVSEYALSEIDGTTIQAGDRKVLMTATAGVEPKPSDVLTISGKAYTVINAMPLAPAGVAVMRSEEHTSELQSRENLVCR